MFHTITPQYHVLETPFRMMGTAIGGRAALFDLGGGKLLVHSPVQLNPETLAEIKALGQVQYILAPNRFHHLFALDWRREFPEAKLLAEPAHPKLKPQIELRLPLEGALAEELSPHFEILQIQGVPKSSEFVLLHKPSRTLVTTDLCFNLQGRTDPWTWLFFSMNNAWGRFTPSSVMKLMIQDKAAFAASLQQIANWDFERIHLCHGQLVETGGKALFQEAFAKYLTA